MWTHTHTHMHTDSHFECPLTWALCQYQLLHWSQLPIEDPPRSLLSISSWRVSSFQPLERKRCCPSLVSSRGRSNSLRQHTHCGCLQRSCFCQSLVCAIHWNLSVVDRANSVIAVSCQASPHLQLAGFSQALDPEMTEITNSKSNFLRS